MSASVVDGDAMEVLPFSNDSGNQAIFQCSQFDVEWNVTAARSVQ